MTKSAIDQKEYLKKYLRSDKDVKQKKKKNRIGSKTVKIIDDDIDFNHIRPVEDGEFDILNSTEDAPQIVGIIDERGPVDFADKRRWKIIADDGEGNVAVSCSQTKSRDNDEIIQKTTKLSKIDKSSSENGNYNKNPSRKTRKESDDDLSPLRKTHNKKKTKKHRRKSSSSDSTASSSSSSSSDSSDSEADAKRKAKSKKASKNRKNHRKDVDSDLSPPRPRKRKDSDDLSPPRKSEKNSETLRRKMTEIDTDFRRKSQKNYGQKNEDSDLSPPRSRRRKDTDSDLSPPRKSQADSRSAERRRNNDSDMSPPRKSRREDTRVPRGDRRFDSDLSPPRKFNESRIQSSRQNRGSDSDLSPPRKSQTDSRSTERRRNNDMDLSPPRNRRNDQREDRSDARSRTSDSSRRHDDRGTRKKSSRWDDNRERRKSQSPDNDRRMKKTLDGRVAGLQDAKAMREETQSYKEKEKEIFSKMSAEISGEGRAPVLRDRKTGKRRNLEAEAAEKREKEKKQEEIDEKYAKWGRGLKQVDDHNEKLMDDLYEMSKPLARYADDVDLDARQRATEYAEDPMLSYIKGKQIKEGKREPDAPTYEGSFMPNRFGIKPGHRWDGVDRSNGYEKKWFEARNAKAAVQEEAYKWSTADM